MRERNLSDSSFSGALSLIHQVLTGVGQVLISAGFQHCTVVYSSPSSTNFVIVGCISHAVCPADFRCFSDALDSILPDLAQWYPLSASPRRCVKVPNFYDRRHLALPFSFPAKVRADQEIPWPWLAYCKTCALRHGHRIKLGAVSVVQNPVLLASFATEYLSFPSITACQG